MTHHATVPGNHDCHDYAERIRDRLSLRLQAVWEAMGLCKVHPGS